MINKGFSTSISFVDMVYILLCAFIIMFVYAFLQINPKAKKADIETKAEYVITVTWPKGYKSDVDTWLEDPGGNVVNYRAKDQGMAHLDRDDLGNMTDSIYINGEKIYFPFNQELTTIRGNVPGEWVLNLHMYKHRDNGEVPVTVKITKLNPKAVIVFTDVIKLVEHWQEKTVVRFNMTKDGDIIKWSRLPKSLLRAVHQ